MPTPACDGSPFIIAVPAPQTRLRSQARERVRGALRASLGKLLGCAPEAVPLDIRPGEAPVLVLPPASIHLSISHEAGLSLAAIRVGGRIGIDLVAFDDAGLPDQEALARDYLGPRAAEALHDAPAPQRPAAFARLWTAHEACLKCLGLPLQEWSPGLAGEIARCRIAALRLPASYVGAAAFLE
ncbi:MAG: 4'-phosphopantetheinyl transferase family protein [Burkholderiaceae bacterium]